MTQDQNKTTTIDATDVDNHTAKPFQTILFNDETHDQIEVSVQIIKAIHCTPERAMEIMLEAHNTGRAVVIAAGLERCEHVAAVLEQIRLGTKVEPA